MSNDHDSSPSLTGSRIGAYELGPRIGAGGMGQVYRATDTKLRRTVAVKVLPPGFGADPDRLARFEREARDAVARRPYTLCLPGRREYDVRADGRFIVVKRKLVAGVPRQMVLLQGWQAGDPGRGETR